MARTEMPLSELVVLGMLSEKPRHGYEIGREIEARRLRRWTRLGHSLLYNVLQRVRQRGWATVKSAKSTDGPDAAVFRLTAKGRSALRRALVDALAEGFLEPSRTELALMFCAALGEGQLANALEHRARRLEAEVEASGSARERHASRDPEIRRVQTAIFDHFDAVLRADQSWTTRARKMLG